MVKRTALYATLVAGAFVSVFPYLLVALTALKTPRQLSSTEPWEPGLPPTFANLDRVLHSGFAGYLGNTVQMTAALTAGQLVFTTFAAYAFARLRFRGRDVLFWLYVATMMVPSAVTMIPLFLIMRELHLVNKGGADAEGFPLPGSTVFGIGRLNGENGFTLVCGNNKRYLCAYALP